MISYEVAQQFYYSKDWSGFKHEWWGDVYRAQRFYTKPEQPDQGSSQDEWNDYFSEMDAWSNTNPRELGGGYAIVCAYCDAHKSFVWNFEHILPVRKYWDLRLNPTNIVIACNHCNKEKGNKVLRNVSDIVKKYQLDVARENNIQLGFDYV